MRVMGMGIDRVVMVVMIVGVFMLFVPVVVVIMFSHLQAAGAGAKTVAQRTIGHV